jgi:drug/metabolite transporter (DMT)-like permease
LPRSFNRSQTLCRSCANGDIAYNVRVNHPSREVPPQIPVRLQRYEESPYAEAPASPRRKLWFHPMSGLLILGVDWFFFAPEAMTGALAAIITSPLAFFITMIGVFWIQRRRNGDSFSSALLKALLGGIVAGIPTSISGTIFGTLVLVLSGLSSWNQRQGK